MHSHRFLSREERDRQEKLALTLKTGAAAALCAVLLGKAAVQNRAELGRIASSGGGLLRALRGKEPRRPRTDPN